jgi:hypothetical protein
MAHLLDKPEHWHQRAKQIRAVTAAMSDLDAKRIMLDIAEAYDLLAKRAEDRAARRRSSA